MYICLAQNSVKLAPILSVDTLSVYIYQEEEEDNIHTILYNIYIYISMHMNFVLVQYPVASKFTGGSYKQDTGYSTHIVCAPPNGFLSSWYTFHIDFWSK